MTGITGGPFFDPSSGVEYTGPPDFENKAIKGWAIRVDADNPQILRARPKGAVRRSCSNDRLKGGRMRLHLIVLVFLISMLCPLVGFAQYGIVPESVRQERVVLNDGNPVQRQTFQISIRRVVGDKKYIATLIRDDQTGVVWFTYEAANNTQTTQPGNIWVVAKSKDGRSLVGFQADSSALFFRTSNRTAGSMESARSLAMTELSAEIAEQEANRATYPRIDLRPYLDFSAFSGASGLRQGDIKRVTATDDGWLVELSSHPALARTALVYLSQDLKVLKVDVRKN